MSSQNYEAEIAAFILAKGITQCPTACARADLCVGERGGPGCIARARRTAGSASGGEEPHDLAASNRGRLTARLRRRVDWEA